MLGLSGTLACFPTPGGDDTDTDGSSEDTAAPSDSTGPGMTTMPADDADGATSTTGSVPQAPACADYLACLEDAGDRGLAEAEAMYGQAGSCWVDAATAAPCAEQCDAGFETCSLADGDGTGDPPLLCSLSMLAPGVESPVVMGDRADVLPTEIGVIVEDFCGCHLVESNDQLVRLTPAYNGLIRFRTLEEFHQPFGGQPTYREIEVRSITQQNMPPVYHCDTLDFGSWPAGAYETFAAWLAADAPDGASWPIR